MKRISLMLGIIFPILCNGQLSMIDMLQQMEIPKPITITISYPICGFGSHYDSVTGKRSWNMISNFDTTPKLQRVDSIYGVKRDSLQRISTFHSSSSLGTPIEKFLYHPCMAIDTHGLNLKVPLSVPKKTDTIITNPLALLESRMGCVFTPESDKIYYGPNMGRIRIQSVNSLQSNTGDTLWLINGCVISGTPENVLKGHENDFKVSSIIFVKDSIACAAYGSRGANGAYVIVVERIDKNSKENYQFKNGCMLFGTRYNRKHKNKYIPRTRAGYFIRFRFKKAFNKS